MHRFAACLLTLALLAPTANAASPTGRTPAASTATGAGEPPHAWLFGSWAGGFYPVAGTPSAMACLGLPTVIFTHDVVLRASVTDVQYIQRLIETARTKSGRTDFQFTVQGKPAGGGILGLTQDQVPAKGFGCESPDVLHVQWVNDNQITFPGCSDFPYPLVRCPGR
jgi:hypothetical protein